LLDLLTRVPGTYGALARLIRGEREAADRECSFSQNLLNHIETTAPAREEEEGVKAPRFAHVGAGRPRRVELKRMSD
jgi:hypothetical protein